MFRITAFLLGLSILMGTPAAAQAPSVSIQFQNGYVSLQARNAPLRTILNEWARTGRTTIINADRVAGAPLTIQLTNVPEREALATLLRSVSGYVLGARQVASSGPSTFDRIMIVPTSSVAATPARVFTNTPSATPGAPGPQPATQPPPPVAFVPGDPDDSGAQDGSPNRVLTAAQLQQQLNARAAAARAAEQAQEEDAARTSTPAARTPANPIFSGPSGRPGEITPIPQQPRNPLRPNGDPEP
jgi:hypothetical protein